MSGSIGDRMLDPHRVHFGSVERDRLPETLARAEHAFADDHDLVAGLYAAKTALEHRVEVPRKVANWLAYGLSLYLHGRRDSIDAALGLNRKGRASPRRKHAEDTALRAALGRMLYLQVLGATISQAAALVARLSPDYTVATLVDRYKRGGYGAEARQMREALRPALLDPESTLAEYPDRPFEVAQAKAAIRKVYAKHRL